VLQLTATLGLIALLLGAAEWADPEAGIVTRRDRIETRVALGWMALYVVYAPLIGWVASLAIRGGATVSPLTDRLAALPWATRFAGAVLVADVTAYALHRLMHTVPSLWRLHAVHHGATDLRWWTAFRFHPLETALIHVLPYAIASLVGFGTDVAATHLVVVAVVTILAHADVHVPGRVLAKVIVTPGYHRSHHEIHRGRTNFALVLPCIDVLFRTASFAVVLPRRFGLAAGTTSGRPRPALGTPAQLSKAIPTVNETTLTSALAIRATCSSRSQRRSMAASRTITPTSTRISETVRPTR
jgi:sterol desaturase/sphingolipid hydroxylase (fatty acid hydroxylase superfamily)